MAKVDYGFSLTEKALADSLEITVERLDEIIAFFDSDPDDEWHLAENEHYVFVNKKLQERLFSLMGAYVIAEYVRRTERSTLLERFVEFITRHKAKIRESFVAGHIVRNCSSLVLWSNRHFLSKRDTIKILATSPARLNRSFQELQNANLMRKSVDFRDDEGVRYYSIRGLSRLADDLAKKLTSNERRYWCEAVKITGEKTLKLIASEEDNRRIRIDKACELAKKRDKITCQVTGKKNEKKIKSAS